MVAAPKKHRSSTVIPLELFPSSAYPSPAPSVAPAAPSKGFNDPAFATNKAQPIHQWVPWIAGFSAQFVKDALGKYLARPGVILDPFAGVGTTLVEALRAGHDAVGFEINPYAALASQVKTAIAAIALADLIQACADFQDFYAERIAGEYQPQSRPPTGFKSRAPFYSSLVLRKVLIVQDFIAALADDTMRRLFQLAFAATMVTYSNYSYEPSLGRRVSSGKEEILDFPVADAITAKLQEFIADIAWFQQCKPARQTHARVIQASFFAYNQFLAPDSIDCVITSPPYLNNYHYNRNTRPHLYWLGFAHKPTDLRALEEANFGKYWQTVRDQPALALDFALSGSDLAERIATVRQCNPARGIYGGNGWANYATSYFNDCYKLANGIKYVLKPGGTALVVIGNSILQGVFMPTDRHFGEIAAAVGLELIGITTPRAARVGNSIIKSKVRVAQAQDDQQLYEAIVEVRKPQ
jgi:DNA modification methylase